MGGDASKDQEERVVGLSQLPPAQHRAKGKKNPPFPSPGMKQELHEKNKLGLRKRCFHHESNENCQAQGRAQRGSWLETFSKSDYF